MFATIYGHEIMLVLIVASQSFPVTETLPIYLKIISINDC